MAKRVHDDMLDGALLIIKNNCDRMTACTGEPASFSEANVGGAKFLADVAMGSGDFVLGDGVTSGRRVAVAQKSGITVDHSGTVDHVALLDTVNERLLYVTTCAAQALTE